MSENKQTNNNMLFGVIIALLVVIAVLAFFVGKNMSGGTVPTGTEITGSATGEDLEITIYDDARCTTCGTQAIVDQLKQVPFLSSATFTTVDFADAGVEDFLVQNNITNLPAAVFNSNQINDGGTMSPYLIALPDGAFSLQLGSTFDPFITRSDKGFLVLEGDTVNNIKQEGYIQGNPEAQITWIEYSDLECPFCAKLHNSTTIEDVKAKYGENLNIVFQHFPLDFHANALPGAEIAECLGAQQGSEAFYSLIDVSFAEENSTKSFLIDEAVKLGANQETLEACVNENTYEEKILAQQTTGQTVFGVTGTPGNVLINNATGEYEVISGAYPTESFTEVIDKMLTE